MFCSPRNEITPGDYSLFSVNFSETVLYLLNILGLKPIINDVNTPPPPGPRSIRYESPFQSIINSLSDPVKRKVLHYIMIQSAINVVRENTM